jgi:hypothetical protein
MKTAHQGLAFALTGEKPALDKDPHASTLKKNFPHVLVLNREKIRPIFEESIIIFCKSVNRKKIFSGIGNMKDIVETKIMFGSII